MRRGSVFAVTLALSFDAAIVAQEEDILKNGEFEQLTADGMPLSWVIVQSLPTEEEITVVADTASVYDGRHCLRNARYNEKAPHHSIKQTLNVTCAKGDKVVFGGWVRLAENMGGASGFSVSLIDGREKKQCHSSPPVDKEQWTLSQGEYRFRFGGKLRYFTTLCVPSATRRTGGSSDSGWARGVFLYDNLFVKVFRAKTGEGNHE